MKNIAGFTLIEVLIAMAVSLVIMGGAYTVFNSQQQQTVIQANVSDTQQTLRAVMDYVSRDLRMAGYDPEISSSFGIIDIKFRAINDSVSVDGNSFIRFSADKDSDGTIDNEETMDYSLVNSATITPGVWDLYLRNPSVTAPSRDVLGSNIVALGLAYAIDVNGDGELDQTASGGTAWFIDADNDNDWDSLTVNPVAGTSTTIDTGIAVVHKDIRAVRIWMLGQSQAPDPKYTDNNTYVVGPHVIQPNNSFRHRMLERTVLCRNMGLNL